MEDNYKEFWLNECDGLHDGLNFSFPCNIFGKMQHEPIRHVQNINLNRFDGLYCVSIPENVGIHDGVHDGVWLTAVPPFSYQGICRF